MTRIALVTGAGSGVGRYSARAMARDGFSVVLAGRRREALEESAELVAKEGGETLVAPADVRDADSVARLFAATEERFGRLDVLFNNAGLNVPATPFEDLTLDQWSLVIDTNLTGVFLCTREAFRLMKKQDPMGGRIINNGSVSAYSPRPDAVPYTAAKNGVTGLTKSTSLDGRKYNIVCGQIDIGNAETDMTARLDRGVLQADGSKAVEPKIDVEHIARAVAQMASLPLDANIQFITVMASQMPLIGRG